MAESIGYQWIIEVDWASLVKRGFLARIGDELLPYFHDRLTDSSLVNFNYLSIEAVKNLS